MHHPKHAQHAAPKYARYAPKHARHATPKYAQPAAVALTTTLAALALGAAGTGMAIASHPSGGGAASARPASASHLLADGAASIASDGAYSIASDGSYSIASDGANSIASDGAYSIASDGSYSIASDGANSIASDGANSIASDGPASIASDLQIARRPVPPPDCTSRQPRTSLLPSRYGEKYQFPRRSCRITHNCVNIWQSRLRRFCSRGVTGRRAGRSIGYRMETGCITTDAACAQP